MQYNWYILETTLVNCGLKTAALENLTPEQAEMFLVYLETQGNRPNLFPGYANTSGGSLHYGIPPGALDDERFVAML